MVLSSDWACQDLSSFLNSFMVFLFLFLNFLFYPFSPFFLGYRYPSCRGVYSSYRGEGKSAEGNKDSKTATCSSASSAVWWKTVFHEMVPGPLMGSRVKNEKGTQKFIARLTTTRSSFLASQLGRMQRSGKHGPEISSLMGSMVCNQ